VSDNEDSGGKSGHLSGPVGYVHRAILMSLALLGAVWSLEIHSDLGIIIFKEQFLALIFTLGMTGVFLAVPARKVGAGTGPAWYDWIFVLATLGVGGFVIFGYPVIRDDLGLLSIERMTLGTIAVGLVMEATRRVAGWALIVLAGFLIFYTAFADYFPGFLNAPAESWDRLSVYMYLDSNALFGFPLTVTVSMIVAFILFGRMLYAVNGAEVLTDFAMAAMGRFRGGPAKVAVLASSFFGTISGSAVANVLMDGPITIPMMRKAGYPGHLAAAVEAVASTGGQIMPPVMGITAFIMAEFMAVPYGDVVLAALLPALLYYIALFAQVDLEAGRYNMAPLPRDMLPKMGKVLARGLVFIIPIFLLIWTLMVERWQPGKSAMVAAIATLIIGTLHPYTRPTWSRLVKELVETGRIIMDLVVITAIAGIIIGLLQLSGLAFNVSLLLTEAAGGSLAILLFLTAVVCIVLGMGMPSAVIYIVLSVIAAPALIEAGVGKMSAHMFLFYFGMLSMITPPVCLATIAAASVAGTNFWETGWAGVRLGFVAYIVPFLFVFYPELVFEGSAGAIIAVMVKSTVGVIVMCYFVSGFLYDRLGWPERMVLGVAGLAILAAPYDTAVGLAIIAAGLAVTAVIFARGRARRRASRTDSHLAA
jgi:TRAP transporter 4TM/12TM fusion protein